MRYPASEKVEIIRLVEQSHLSVRRTLEQIGVSRPTFYRWYDRYQTGGPEALEDRPSRPSRVWNRIPDDIRQQILTLALKETELSPRELAVRFTDKTTRPNEMWQTDFTYLKIIGWGCLGFGRMPRILRRLRYLSTILDDCSRYIIAWKLCTTMSLS